MYLQQTANALALNQQHFYQQVNGDIPWQNELLNMFFPRCSYKNSCYSELAYNSSVFVLIQ